MVLPVVPARYAAFPGALRLLAIAGAIHVAWLGVSSIRSGLKGGGGPAASSRLARVLPPTH